MNPTCKRDNTFFKPSTLFRLFWKEWWSRFFFIAVWHIKDVFFVFFVRLSPKNLDRPKQLYSSWILAWRNSDNLFLPTCLADLQDPKIFFHRWVGEFSSLRMDLNSGYSRNGPARIHVFLQILEPFGDDQFEQWMIQVTLGKERNSLRTMIQVASPRKKKDEKLPSPTINWYCWWKKSCTTWDVENLVK